MVSEAYKKRADSLVKKAKEKGLIKSYEDFLKTDLAKETSLTKEEVAYYISKKEEKEWDNIILEI